MKTLFYILATCVCCHFTAAQEGGYFIYAGNPAKHKKRTRIELGQKVEIKTEQGKISGMLTKIRPDSLVIGEVFVSPDDVKVVYDYSKGGLARQAVIKLPAAGVLYLIIGGINNLVYYREPPIWDERDFIGAGSLVAGGLLCIPLMKKRIRIKNRQYFRVVPL